MATTRDCNGNPINYVDPTGHWAWELHGSFTYYWLKSLKLSAGQRKAIAAGDMFADRENTYFHNRNKGTVKHHEKTAGTGAAYLKYATGYFKAKNANQRTAIQKKAHLNGKLSIERKKQTIQNMSGVSFFNGGYAFYGGGLTLSVDPRDYKNNQKNFSAFILGIGLHAIQDRFAHCGKKGKLVRPHSDWNDDIQYGWNGKFYKRIDKNPRFKAAKRATLKYVKQYIAACR